VPFISNKISDWYSFTVEKCWRVSESWSWRFIAISLIGKMTAVLAIFSCSFLNR